MILYGGVVLDLDTGKYFHGDLDDMNDKSLWVDDIGDAMPFFDNEQQVAYDIAFECGFKTEIITVAVEIASITQA